MFLPSNYGNSELTFEQQQALAKQQGKQQAGQKGLDIFGQGLQSFFSYKTAKQGGVPASTPYYDTYAPVQEPPKDNTGLIILSVVGVGTILLGSS